MAVRTDLFLVRHGEANCNVAGIVGGDKGCTGLTDRGRWQAEQLAGRLSAEHAELPFEVVYASPRRRVRETSDIVTTALGARAIVEPKLLDLRAGEADGLPWREVETVFGAQPQEKPHLPYAPGAESWNSYLGRVTRILEDLVTRHRDQRVLVLAHGETVEASFSLMLGLAAESVRDLRFGTQHTGITHWRIQENPYGQITKTLMTCNDVNHLANSVPCGCSI
ncbi:histidine phosphatase family protein [Streptomyces sp. NPDC060184]|uniref:histidine phosphatase family protein n=1 Tax=Streptomyces sp. NPDC060184 TaxID=3347064 RepID=UPI0036560704